ncbi:MAG: PDZ domain-containing protein [Planctomycetota bacterium]|jgi:hypothetical protein
MRRLNWIAAMVVACGLGAAHAAPTAPGGYMGAQLKGEGAAVSAGERSFVGGVRLTRVVPDSPAEQSGFKTGDLVVECPGILFGKDAEANNGGFREILRGGSPGDTLALTVVRGDAVLELTLTLGRRPGAIPNWEKALPADTGFTVTPEARLGVQPLVEKLVAAQGIGSDYSDLRRRLDRLTQSGDPYKLPIVAAAMRDPYAMAPLARTIAGLEGGPVQVLAKASWALGAGGGFLPGGPRLTDEPRDLDAHVAFITERLERATALRGEAFAALTAAEQEELQKLLPVLGRLFIAETMWPLGKNPQKPAAGRAVVLAAKVDVAKLVAAAAVLAPLVQAPYLESLRRDLAEVVGPEQVVRRETPHGDMVFAGTGKQWHRKPAAFLFDLGGDDFYTQQTNPGVNVVIDAGGNDAYEATFGVAHGAALMGVSMVVDLEGDDTYVAQRWGLAYVAQRWGLGAAFCGVGILWDHAGDDRYRGKDFSQGVAFCGVGALLDGAGDDRYDAPAHAQGVGLPGGFGALVDGGDGGDEYFCKGRDQTGYGDEGIFDAWSQGVGVGFRGLASGGLGVLVDHGGVDRYEAGNFSQGGGYYFGWGCLVDRGDGDDLYIGSRYAQAYAAHQAIGFFEDHGGNDRYTTRQGVAQSCSWDETVTTFIDRAGDDVYEGGKFFSQGAAAHNGFSLLLDYGGSDTYDYKPGQSQAKSNDYHGGTSLGLFIDLGGATDVYTGGKMKSSNDAITHRDSHGFQCDLPVADLAEATKRHAEWMGKRGK